MEKIQIRERSHENTKLHKLRKEKAATLIEFRISARRLYHLEHRRDVFLCSMELVEWNSLTNTYNREYSEILLNSARESNTHNLPLCTAGPCTFVNKKVFRQHLEFLWIKPGCHSCIMALSLHGEQKEHIDFLADQPSEGEALH